MRSEFLSLILEGVLKAWTSYTIFLTALSSEIELCSIEFWFTEVYSIELCSIEVMSMEIYPIEGF